MDGFQSIGISFSKGLFSGSMLVLGGVIKNTPFFLGGETPSAQNHHDMQEIRTRFSGEPPATHRGAELHSSAREFVHLRSRFFCVAGSVVSKSHATHNKPRKKTRTQGPLEMKVVFLLLYIALRVAGYNKNMLCFCLGEDCFDEKYVKMSESHMWFVDPEKHGNSKWIKMGSFARQSIDYFCR